MIELRLPWGLINVADPSSRRVIHETDRVDDVVQTTLTEGLRFHVLALDGDADAPDVADALPALPAPELSDFPAYLWPTWEQADYRLELKPSYFILQQEFSRLP